MSTSPLCRLISFVTLCLCALIAGLFPSHGLAAEKLNDCAPNSQDKSLIGVWESRQTSMGGLGVIMEFREDGGWVDTIGAIVDSHGETPPPLVGVQKLPGTTGDGFAFMNFLADGKTQYREPFPKPWGCYEVIGSKLRLCAAGCPPEEISYKIKNATLELTGKKGKQTLNRVEPAWYHPLNEKEVEAALKSFNAKEEKEKP